jgi:hypothetical protein
MLKTSLLSILIASSPLLMGTPVVAGEGGASLLLVAAGMSGTPKEQAACRPDVRRFCSHVKQGSDSSAYLSCLEANRSKLSKACLGVLESHGQ